MDLQLVDGGVLAVIVRQRLGVSDAAGIRIQAASFLKPRLDVFGLHRMNLAKPACSASLSVQTQPEERDVPRGGGGAGLLNPK